MWILKNSPITSFYQRCEHLNPGPPISRVQRSATLGPMPKSMSSGALRPPRPPITTMAKSSRVWGRAATLLRELWASRPSVRGRLCTGPSPSRSPTGRGCGLVVTCTDATDGPGLRARLVPRRLRRIGRFSRASLSCGLTSSFASRHNWGRDPSSSSPRGPTNGLSGGVASKSPTQVSSGSTQRGCTRLV